MKFKLLSLSLMYSFLIQAQTDELFFLKGKIVCEINDVIDVNVLNKRSESNVATESKGDFSIFVKVGDTLSFSGLQIFSKYIVISKNDLLKTLLAVTLQPKVFELQEVKVTQYPNINAVSLGILDKPAKKYTPAERKLRTAGVFKWYSPLLIPLGGMSVDGLINSISGRTAMLKKELEVERKELVQKKLANYFDEQYFTTTLKIPLEYVEGFLYFASEDSKIRELISNKNKILLQFQLNNLAVQYLKIISSNE
ncbi:hypothetical protein [Flavobacterium sp.]